MTATAALALFFVGPACNRSALDLPLPSDMLNLSDMVMFIAGSQDLPRACASATLDCDHDPANGCETLPVDNPNHCGACGVKCSGDAPVCSGNHCKGRLDVLLVTSSLAPLSTDVRQKLADTGAFSAVDLFDTASATPTLQTLMQYGAILAWDNSGADDPTQEPLTAYFLAGGRVVFADATVMGIGGAFLPYMTIVNTGNSRVITSDGMGQILDPGSPLMAGVHKIEFTIQAVGWGKIVNGASAIANWRTGEPFVVAGVIAGRRRVDLNFPPWSHDVDDQNGWIGDGAILIKNALLYE